MAKIRSIILLLAGTSIIFLMIHVVGAGDVIEVIYQADPPLFLVAVICEFAAVALWAVRWRILLRPFQQVRFKNSFAGILIGIFFNNITPVARAGGEPFRAYFLGKKEGIDFENTFATVAIDRVLDSFPFLIIMTISLAYFILLLEISAQMIIILCIALFFNVILLSLVLYFSFSLKAAKGLMFSLMRIIAKFSKRAEKYESKIEEAVEQYHGAIRKLSSRRKDLTISLSISFVFWFLVILRNYLVVVALGYEVNFMVIVVVQTVGTLVGVLPILPGGLGSIDGAMVFLYFSFGFPAALAVTASLLDRFLSFWMMMAVGAVCVFVEREFLKDLG
ncbi:MAG: flippase-like domain-containing protein [Theionarchaea archaeon]|nr:flippase-like domain-containing protein [Theionarchaea archaeon]